ncbi:MAG: hypothetical protein IJ654_00400 [Bacteroidales bacterium]|nr:hypothetical protein [Bacteroidales bacterium]
MSDFQQFIEINGLKKKDVASFLGVSNAFITQLCDGTKPLPPAKLALIKANKFGWDISMFESPTQVTIGRDASGVIVNGNNVSSPIQQDNRQYYSDSPDVLRATIDLLDERIKEKDAQIKQLLDIVQGLKK